jgi:hypothetical protein
MLASLLVYGVMVTQLFLVQSFKVRVLVDQHKASHLRGFFYGIYLWLEIKENKAFRNMERLCLLDVLIF